MRGVKFFSRTSSEDYYNLLSYHPPHSLTWTWIISLCVRKRGEGKQLAFNKWRDNQGLQWAIQCWRFVLSWHYQQPMWYRDILNQKRERDERQSYEEYLMRSAASRPEAAPEHRTLQ